MDISNRHYLDELKTGILLLDGSLKVKYLNSSAQSMLETSLKASKNKGLEENLDKFLDSLNNKTDFAKLDALLFIKGGKKLLCDYHIQSFEDNLIGEGFILEIQIKTTLMNFEKDLDLKLIKTALLPLLGALPMRSKIL